MPKKALLTLFFSLLALPLYAEEVKPVPAAPAAKPAVETPAPAPASTPATAPAQPAPASVSTAPDISNMLFVQNLRKGGATIYYLGNALGLNGWFALKEGQVQIFYTTPDNKAMLVGALLSAEGAPISQQQLTLFAKDHPEIINTLQNTPLAGAAPPAPQEEAQLPPSEQIFTELSGAAHVTIGKMDAPLLLMVVDVNCPHCHKTWKMLQKAVEGGRLRVQLIPVPAMGEKSTKEEAIWLAAPDPAEAWKKRVAGDEKILGGTPAKESLARVASNMALIQRWKIAQTPTILYRGKNGKVRVIVGEPASEKIILDDIGV